MTTWRISLCACVCATGIWVPGTGWADSSSTESIPSLSAPAIHSLQLTLKEALSVAVQNKPDVLLYKEHIQEAVGLVLSQRPEIQAHLTRVKASELTYSAIPGERILPLVAQGEYGFIGNRWTNTHDTYNMALALQIPIFDGVQREGCIAQAGLEMAMQELDLARSTGILHAMS